MSAHTMDNVLPGYSQHTADPERGQGNLIPLGDLETWSSHHSSAAGTASNHLPEDSYPKERLDFDDGANALWTLYGKEAKTHDEARFENLGKDMDGVLIFAGLFSAVLTSFLVHSLQSLQVNPAEQSVYYQNQSAYYQWQSAYLQQQSVAMLANISQQLATITLQASVSSVVSQVSTPSAVSQLSASSIVQQVPIPSTPPPPYPAFKPLVSDIVVNAFWIVGLVCSLSAASLAILVQQWVRSYMQVFQQYDHPLKRARFRQFFSEGANGMRNLAEHAPQLIHVSLILFLLGLGYSMLHTNSIITIATVVPICLCGSYYLYSVMTHVKDLPSPYKTPILRPIFFLFLKYQQLFGDRRWRTYKNFEGYQEELVMEEKGRKNRDVRAIQWLVHNTAVNAQMEPLVLAIPGTFNTEWGREVWMNISDERWTNPDTFPDRPPAGGPAPLIRHSRRFPEGTAGDTICRCVRDLFETCRNGNNFPNDDARRQRIRACVEAAASLVCFTDFQLDWFGEVSKPVSEIGRLVKIDQSPTTTSDQSFIIRWTCLSLLSVQQILSSNKMRVLAGMAVSGLARAQLEYGQADEPGSRIAQRIDECLKTAWERVEELRRAFEPWNQQRTRKQVKEILRDHERQISELERIKAEADNMEDFDWRISLYQDAMDETTFGLARQLPGVSFDKQCRTESLLLSDTFITQATGTAPVIPQLIFPGQQLQALARIGLKLREVLDGHEAADGHEVIESLKFVEQIPVSLRRPKGLMKRQLWRLQDLRDGSGLGFTIELFFLSLRRLLSITSLHESNCVLYTGAFKVTTSRWEESKDSLGTQLVLLNIICDLIIKSRGIFSDVKYPEAVTDILVDVVGHMLGGHAGLDEDILNALQEIEDVDALSCMDTRLWRRALAALSQSRDTS